MWISFFLLFSRIQFIFLLLAQLGHSFQGKLLYLYLEQINYHSNLLSWAKFCSVITSLYEITVISTRFQRNKEYMSFIFAILALNNYSSWALVYVCNAPVCNICHLAKLVFISVMKVGLPVLVWSKEILFRFAIGNND